MRVERGPAPEGIDVGETTVRAGDRDRPRRGLGRSPASSPREVLVALDPQGFDVDREVEAHPVDANGETVTGVDVEPATVHVQIPLFTEQGIADPAGQPGHRRHAGAGVPDRVASRWTR